MPLRHALCAGIIALCCAASSWAAGPAVTDPADADADFAIQGEYVGDVAGGSGKETWGAQVIALGESKFRLVGYPGGGVVTCSCADIVLDR